eukprot:Lankesteria_metandrocarpae@DN3349_c0_g1_i1.p1
MESPVSSMPSPLNTQKMRTQATDGTMRDVSAYEGSFASQASHQKITSVKGKILRPYAQGDFSKLYRGIKFIPFLHFPDQNLEASFLTYTNALFSHRLVIVGLFGVVMVIATACVIAYGMVTSLSEPIPIFAYSFGVAELFILIPSIVMLTSPRIPIKFAQEKKELLLYSCMTVAVLAGYVMSVISTSSSRVNSLPVADQWRLASFVLSVAFLTYTSCTGITATVFPTRTKLLFPYIIMAATGMSVTIVLLTLFLTETYVVTPSQVLLHLLTWAVASLLCLARISGELKERVGYFQYTTAREKVQEMAKAMKKEKTKKGGSTGVEEVIELVKRVIRLIETVQIETQNRDLHEALTLLQKVVTKVSNSESLFAVNFDNVDQENRDSVMQVVNAFAQQGPKKGVRFDADVSLKVQSPADRVNDKLKHRNRSLATMMRIPDHSELKAILENLPVLPPCILTEQLRGVAGDTWALNLLNLSAENSNILLEIGMAILTKNTQDLDIDIFILKNLIFNIQKRYFDNPYHNATHGATVAHTSRALCRMAGVDKSECFSSVDEVTFVLSALGHDMGHPGRNNAYLVACVHPLALLYNDTSVLENFHSALLFMLLSQPDLNVYQNITPEAFQQHRSRIIELILATDMKQHFEGVTKFRVRRASPEFDYVKNPDDMWLMLKMCLKAGDLSHGALEWLQHTEWSFRVVEEFYKQGDEEASLGLPKSPLCDRATHKDLAKSQRGFLEFVVIPLFTELSFTNVTEIQSVNNCLYLRTPTSSS